jgi:hypothetical protein
MQQEIKYIGFYDVPDSKFKRVCALAATNKMDYIAEAIIHAGYQVHLVSPSWFDDTASNAKYCAKITIQQGENKKLTLAPGVGTSNKLTGYFKIIFSLFWLFSWIVLNVKKNEKIIVYHSPWLVLPVLFAKRIKRFQIILEVEEIYGDVSSLHPYFDKLEKKAFYSSEFFLFSTELLAKRLQIKSKYLVIYGNYKVYDLLALPKNDGKIHLIYAGIIDSEKAGAFNAIESALYLNENYVMHIIGFGEVDKLQLRIDEINKKTKCKVLYGGIKTKDDFISYCQTCHIGLSTQKMEGKYVSTSFPSKILTYMGLGLAVVSGGIDVVKKSKIRDFIQYYDIDTPEALAAAILKVGDRMNVEKNKSIILQLDEEFILDIKSFLKAEY